MQQLLNTAKCFRLSYRIIPKTPGIRSFSEKCKKGGDTEKPKEPTELKCKTKKEEKKETTISGGPKCGGGEKEAPPKSPPKSDQESHDQANLWKKISLMGAFPLVAIIALFVFTSHKEEERPDFKFWPHMYKRSKPFFFGPDGNRSAFHNPHINPLPPDGYEDEVDSGAEGKPAESDEERDQRIKEFGGVKKEWSKLAVKREAEAKKAEAAAEKEAKRLQAEAEKEEKNRKAEEEKERKRIEALEKKQVAAEAKERKRLEALEAKRLKEEAKKKPQEVGFVNENEPDDLPPE